MAAELDKSSAFYWDSYDNTTMGRYLFACEYAFIRRFLPAAYAARWVPEVACGSGRLTRPLHAAGYQMLGVDVDSVALVAFRSRSHHVPLTNGDIAHLPFADLSVKGLIAIQCLYYGNYRAFLAEFNRVLMDGGVLIFESLYRNSYKWWLKRLTGRTLRLPSADVHSREVLSATHEHGFDIEAVIGYSWAPFARTSNSAWVWPAVRIEQFLRLDRYYSISPRILVAAIKRNSIAP